MYILILIVIVVLLIIIAVGESSAEKLKKASSLYEQNNKIPQNTSIVTCNELNDQPCECNIPVIDEKGKVHTGLRLFIWKDTDFIKLCTTYFYKNNPNNIVEKIIIPIKNIKFFTRDGEYRVDNIVEGGSINLPGAIIGGVIAGEAGAVLAGRKKIKTSQKEVDKRQTYLYYIEDNQDKRIIFDSDTYNILLKLIPNKDFGFIEKNKIIETNIPKENNNIYHDIEQLSKLKDKGILTKEEFIEKKRILLDKIQ
ncbi:hypothetical protein UT300005_05920 [Clostridium sp. CTA-5]